MPIRMFLLSTHSKKLRQNLEKYQYSQR